MRKILLLTFSILLAATGGLLAQGVTTASVSGLVTDQKGEGLPGANVIAVHTPSGSQYGTSTRADGRFTIPNA
ncbi:MAG TPA: carboxypeptidase-like regulatory domain-containing protein, partial [Cyclobacteriaceae bacterium]